MKQNVLHWLQKFLTAAPLLWSWFIFLICTLSFNYNCIIRIRPHPHCLITYQDITVFITWLLSKIKFLPYNLVTFCLLVVSLVFCFFFWCFCGWAFKSTSLIFLQYFCPVLNWKIPFLNANFLWRAVFSLFSENTLEKEYLNNAQLHIIVYVVCISASH